MGFISDITAYMEVLALKIPVFLFAFIGGLVEEIIAPIPSPVIMALAGSIISAQGKGVLYLLFTSFVGSIAKTIGCWFWYFLGDKGEDFVIDKFGKYVGITHKDLEGVGKHFKNTEKDFLIIMIARALPIAPTTPISVIAGMFKMDLKKYILASFAGNMIRNTMFLYLGFVGLESYNGLLEGLDSVESIVQVLIGLALVGLFGFLYMKRRKTNDPIQQFFGKFLKK